MMDVQGDTKSDSSTHKADSDKSNSARSQPQPYGQLWSERWPRRTLSSSSSITNQKSKTLSKVDRSQSYKLEKKDCMFTMVRKHFRPAPAEISYKNMKFLITEQPKDTTITNFISTLKKHKVTHVVCATDRVYRINDLEEAGVTVTELSFPDGSPPSPEVVDKWLTLVKSIFASDCEACIGVHCVTGLGRAPALVAIALIELGMKYEDAVDMIRFNRPGALNTRQLEFLSKYKRRKSFSKSPEMCALQ